MAKFTKTEKVLLIGSVLMLSYSALSWLNKKAGYGNSNPFLHIRESIASALNNVRASSPSMAEENEIELAGNLSELEAKLNGQISTTENRDVLQKQYDELKNKLKIQ